MRVLLALLLSLLTVGAATAAVSLAGDADDDRPSVRVELRDGEGTVVGTVRLRETKYGTVDVDVATRRGLRSGWHGVHVHETGKCEGPKFASAGGHVKLAGQAHRDHAGDLAPILVKLNGTATGRVTTDRFKLADLRDADGSAIIVHAGPDNFANVPPRYAPNGPDQETLNTGDAGGRSACGVVYAGG